MNAPLAIAGVFVAFYAIGVAWFTATVWFEKRDRRRRLAAHPGRTAFLRHVEAWQIIGSAGPLPAPTVDELVDMYDWPAAEAEAYVAEWDDRDEALEHAERVMLAQYATELLAIIEPNT